jgi:hypothetical protein
MQPLSKHQRRIVAEAAITMPVADIALFYRRLASALRDHAAIVTLKSAGRPDQPCARAAPLDDVRLDLRSARSSVASVGIEVRSACPVSLADRKTALEAAQIDSAPIVQTIAQTAKYHCLQCLGQMPPLTSG